MPPLVVVMLRLCDVELRLHCGAELHCGDNLARWQCVDRVVAMLERFLTDWAGDVGTLWYTVATIGWWLC